VDVCVVGWVLPHVSTIFLLDFETVLMDRIVLHAEILFAHSDIFVLFFFVLCTLCYQFLWVVLF
jgi:hypothetical protein